ncbi:hypothetical protein G5V59_02440 [Nocardioides sp. W3-2-3]|uniref:SGNH/GDSL hydrolase family protein n=1 Tax=Nocardioides convexus TaxID=2712224 RepID=UPI0024185A69|nr:SGNH/GDSL hydrolase family protein [Nocardioides convexus]NGZ99611.1 hypothetical protein [Nocardioides convexus]
MVFPRLIASGSLVGPAGPSGADGSDGAPGVDAVPAAEATAAYLEAGAYGVDDGNDTSTARLLGDPTSQTNVGVREQIANRAALPSFVATRARVNAFDPIRCVYNFKPSNTRRIRAGLGRAGRGGISEHIVAGDSMSAGAVYGISGANPLVFDRAGAWPMMMRDRLVSLGIPSAGSGWVRCNDAGLGSPLGWTFGGTWNHSAKFYSFNLGGGTATFTVPASMAGATAYSHLWFDTGLGGGAYSFTLAVNGATSGPGFRTTTSVGGSARWRATTLLLSTPLAAGDTIVMTAGANGHYMAAGRCWKPATGGISVHNLAQSGSRVYATAASQSDQWASLGQNGLGTLINSTLPNGTTAFSKRTVTDAVLNGTTTMTSATAAFTDDDLGKTISTPAGTNGLRLPASGNVYITAINSATSVTLSQAALMSATGVTIDIGRIPDALHISLGANDLANGVTIANIAAGITTVRGFLPNTDVLLYANPQPSAALIPTGYDAWVSSLYDLADTLDVPLFDMRARFGTFAEWGANGLQGDGLAHANPSLFAEWGLVVAGLIAA